MSLMRQDEIGTCDFLDVLEEAALVKRPIAVELRDGEAFIDEVKDVLTQGGADYVDFLIHGRVAVRDILGTSRAEPAPSRRS
jgi:transcriptional antiterminator Rof (Rho-off)